MKRYISIQETMSKNLRKDVLNKPLNYRYQMLDRFVQDADYYFTHPSPDNLWAGDPVEHADNMIAIINLSLIVKNQIGLQIKSLKIMLIN